MQPSEYLPHVDLMLQAMRINRDRLNSRSKIAIDAKLLRMIIQSAVVHLPFSADFYQRTYPDIAAAVAAGQITDLHRHFVETGFFEGRIGAAPQVDEAFYTGLYPDVAQAVLRGDVASGREHYLRSGVAEGRVPSERLRAEVETWLALLRVNTVFEA